MARLPYADLSAPEARPLVDKIIAQRKDLQDVLGNYQDSIVSAAFLRELGGRIGIRSGHNGFSYGVLYAREIYASDSLLEELKPFL